VAKPSSKAQAWVYFDRIVALAAPGDQHSNPWVKGSDGQLYFEPDYETLEQLLGVPLHLKASTTSGVPALALDVWLSYELRRAGFGMDEVWPRPVNPRILPISVANLIKWLPSKIRDEITKRVSKVSSIPGVTLSCCRFRGHRDRCFMEPEVGYGATAIYARVQA
jgi:hypothetical protein